jgi:hypothetical protein
MTNERKTENLVRDQLREFDYYHKDNGISVEEQKSEIIDVRKILNKASKNNRGNSGYPEFIVSYLKDPSFLIVIECKHDLRRHESAERNKPIEFAVDGVLHYAKHLAKDYTVVAVAVSGATRTSMRVSNFLIVAGSDEAKPLTNESGVVVDSIIPFEDYYRLASFDPDVARKRHDDLLTFSRELHEFIWAMNRAGFAGG